MVRRCTERAAVAPLSRCFFLHSEGSVSIPLCRPWRAPADPLPGVADRVLKVLPGALVTPPPLAPGFRLERRPVLAGIARVGRQGIAVAVGRLTALVGESLLGK